MAFWGIEVKPGNPFSHTFDEERGRLHISQATLGIGSSTQRTLLQCNVGVKSPILLCSLLPEKNESCPLDLEFEEEDEVMFSVLGPRSVHLTGYYIGNVGGCGHEHEDDTDSYGEDIAESETDTEQSTDYGDEDDDLDFIDDDDLEMFSSPHRKSAVVIEEIEDDEKPTNGNGNVNLKRLKKKHHVSDPHGDEDQKQLVIKGNADSMVLESEDEDGFPISSTTKGKASAKSKEDKSEKKLAKECKKEEDVSDHGKGKKRKSDIIDQDSKAENLSEEPKDSPVSSGKESDVKPKKKKKGKKGVKNEDAKIKNVDQDPVEDKPKNEQPNVKSFNTADHVTDQNNEVKKKKKKKNKAQESDENANKELEEKNETIAVTEDKKEKVKRSQVRTFANGLVIEEVQMGKPDGKRASPGNKVSVRYIGKLKKNGKIFDSNIRGPPFEFRLGVGGVIKGWDVGVNGMRVGDKRRLTIPPSMGYGDRGAPPQIPKNAWLVFDVELVNVRA